MAGFVLLFNVMFGLALEFLGREYFSNHLYLKIMELSSNHENSVNETNKGGCG